MFIKLYKNQENEIDMLLGDRNLKNEEIATIIKCKYIEFQKIGKFIVAFDEEGLVNNQGKNNNFGLFAGDVLIGKSKYNKFHPLDKDEEAKEILEAIEFIKEFRALDKKDILDTIYSNLIDMCKKYPKIYKSKNKDYKNEKFSDILKEIISEMALGEINFSFKERLFFQLLNNNYIETL